MLNFPVSKNKSTRGGQEGAVRIREQGEEENWSL